MTISGKLPFGLVIVAVAALSACGNSTGSLGSLGANLFGSGQPVIVAEEQVPANATAGTPPPVRVLTAQRSGSGFFQRKGNQQAEAGVNQHLWNAALDVLAFLPITTADETSGVIVTGFGVPPGGGRAYRATVLVQSSALDARALNISLATRSGAVTGATARAVEDAILARARQLRIAEIEQ